MMPKTGDPYQCIPTLMDFSELICPAERRALREIVETAEVVRATVPSRTLTFDRQLESSTKPL